MVSIYLKKLQDNEHLTSDDYKEITKKNSK